ncbi:phosphatidylinositol 3-/4-kinase [Pseudohyphozyma bogoriensis]|nr:phosphatidylinositol 3-/4-kinase [Pseudohyphozyma bogoriensis]
MATAQGSTQRADGGPTQLAAVPATFDLLNNLLPAVLGDGQQDEDDLVASVQRAHFIRMVLGGWMASLRDEESKNGAHYATSTPETISILSTSIAGPLQYIKSKPQFLLFIPPPTSEPLAGIPSSTLAKGANADASSSASEDLPTFLLPRILRSVASLEAALISSDRPPDSAKDPTAELWRARLDLRSRLDELLVVVVSVLAESGVRLEWQSKAQKGIVQGGIGKAREMVNEMLKLLRALLPSRRAAPIVYPHTVVLFDASLVNQHTANEIFADRPNAIVIKSPLHARGFLLSTLRILHTITSTSSFLAEYFPSVVDLLVESWPSAPSLTLKGKENVDRNHTKIVEATLNLCVAFLETPAVGFSSHVLELLGVRVGEELQERLSLAGRGAADEDMDIDGGTIEERVETALAKIFAKVWAASAELDTGDEGRSKLAHVIASVVMESGEMMVDCVTGEDSSPELRLCCVFALASPLMARPAPSGFDSHRVISSTSSLELVPSTHIGALASFAPLRPVLPCEIPPPLAYLTTLATRAWKSLTAEISAKVGPPSLATQPSTRKRRRDESQHPTSEAGEGEGSAPTATAKRKRAAWMESVAQVLKQVDGDLRLEDEGIENMILRLAKALPTYETKHAVAVLNVLRLLGCARDGSLTFTPVSIPDRPPEPSCIFCDSWSLGATQDSLLDRPARVFTDTPIKGMREAAKSILTLEGNEDVRLMFLKATERLLRHSKASAAALSFTKDDPLLLRIIAQLEASSRPLRLAAGQVLVAIAQAYHEQEESPDFVTTLFKRIDVALARQQPAVTESLLITIGRLARAAVSQGFLECRCLEVLVVRLGHSNIYLKGVARTQLDQIASYREIKTYALVQPHFAVIAPLLIHSRHTASILSAALDCFHQPRESFLRITREHTLPTLILNDERLLIQQIAEASKQPVAHMLLDPDTSAAILSFLYMRPKQADTERGLKVFLREVRTASAEASLSQVIQTTRMGLIYNLALELGDENPAVQEQAVKGLVAAERHLTSRSAKGTSVLQDVLREGIVAMLSYMNKGLNEPSGHRPLRDKQRIIRALEGVISRVGGAVVGFSPQIMATLQSALEIQGLRGVTISAFYVFLTTLRFNEIGPFIASTSASLIRLWPEFSPRERAGVVRIFEYIVVENGEALDKYVRDVADLSGIKDLEKADRRLREIRRGWSVGDRSQFLLDRISSENDVVALQALRELKVLMEANEMQAFSAGDTFDKSVGPIVQTLLAAAAKENEQMRNVAFECIGILGALDPDRFELPPGDPPFIVKRNFDSQEESIEFALHLIQDLLIGAYRSTNDTKHQEFLAFTIQELLRFCGFTEELIQRKDQNQKPADVATLKRWNALPKAVLETCTPLLGGKFTFREALALKAKTYPIYSSTTSYRDWIRTWANDLISKLKGDTVKAIFDAFPPVLHLEDIAVAQHLLPHLVLNALISGDDGDRELVKKEIETVLTDQVTPTHPLSANNRLLSAQTVFSLMDHLSRWITQARKAQADASDRRKKGKSPMFGSQSGAYWETARLHLELVLSDIPHILVGDAALMCKAYARSLHNFESHIIAQQKAHVDDAKLQTYYENLHECYADLDEPDGMEGISTKIVSPSILHQIREHESTGRWTSAQSCWEVKLQQDPDNKMNHVGLLRCLKNLGHYDSMRTHIVGLIHGPRDRSSWDSLLAPFNIEASLIVGDWDAVEDTLQIPDAEGPEIAFGRVISAMRHGSTDVISQAFFEGRERLGAPIVAAGKESYRRVYDSIVHLHILQELGAIHKAHATQPNVISPQLLGSLKTRFDSTSPSFRAREPILNMRRTAFRLGHADTAKREIAELWLETSKIARKAGHSQTAYSAILQARDLSDPKDPSSPFVFLQDSKLLRASDQHYKAIQSIDNALTSRIPPDFNIQTVSTKYAHLVTPGPPSVLAKSSLRRARWMQEAGRLEPEEIVTKYQEASLLAPDWESSYYYLGHYFDSISKIPPPSLSKSARREVKNDVGNDSKMETVKLYSRTLSLGTKYIYQAMPRMLTIWLEMGEDAEVVEYWRLKRKDKNYQVPRGSGHENLGAFVKINEQMKRNAKKLPPYQWLTVLPQLVSRILHPNDELCVTLDEILLRVLVSYPHHGFWAMASGAKSQTAKRGRRSMKLLTKAKGRDGPSEIGYLIDEGLRLVDQLLVLCDYPLTKTEPISMKSLFPDLWKMAPTKLIIPLQSSLNVSLPSDASQVATHKPFPDRLVVFKKFEDTIQIMSSLQKPRKISVQGDDGIVYSFLCKPKDDLRKDARLMEFNSMIIKLLKKDSDARNRRLTIRTYAVVPLNEECGLIEWVPNVLVLRVLLNKLYARHNIAPWSPELKRLFDTIRDVPEKIGERFDKEVRTKFVPVFHEWFLEAFPEPSAWLRARLSYSRTAAVMSMVGFVLGLGDRHCENILIDGTTGDTVHVDFNCLFDRGRSFEVGERVPFRLTTNIIAGMGVTGVEGVYRRAAENTLRILRHNKDSLMSVLETFLHDPLVEWAGKKSRDSGTDQVAWIRRKAAENLDPIGNKLRGLQVTSDPNTKGDTEVDVGEQVERLIREARNSKNLGSMYVGWCSWF